MTRRRGIPAALLVLVACTSGADTPAAPSDAGGGAHAASQPGDAERGALSADQPARVEDDASTTADEGQSRVRRDRSGAVSALERRVSAILTELGAEARGGDTVVVLPDMVLFDFDRATLRPDATAVLDDLVEVIGHFADARLEVHGHTDATGQPAYNEELSERRAQAVVDYLVEAGVDAARVSARGFGATQPIAPNTHPDGSDNPDGRAHNRRVEIILKGVDLDADGRATSAS